MRETAAPYLLSNRPLTTGLPSRCSGCQSILKYRSPPKSSDSRPADTPTHERKHRRLLGKSSVSRGSRFGIRLGSRFENHAVPLAFEQLDRAACDPVSVVAVVVVGARLTVRRALG